MKTSDFFCEECGKPVPLTSKRCPHCEKIFSGVRCPKCGNTGAPKDFHNGCPVCGYLSRKAPAKRPEKRPRFSQTFYDTLKIVLIMAIIVCVIIILLKR